MNRSYSKIRHIQNTNMLLESRRLNEQFDNESTNDEVEPPGLEIIKKELSDSGYDYVSESPSEQNTTTYKFQHAKTKVPLILKFYPLKGKASVFGKKYGIKVGNENEIFFNTTKDSEFRNKFFMKFADDVER